MTTRLRSACVLSVLVQLAACAGYRPLPLPDPESPRVLPELSVSAHAHPRLAAAPVDLTKPLSEWDLARIALAISPDLVAQRSQVEVNQAELFASGLLPDPQLSASLGDPTGAGLVTALGSTLTMELSALWTRAPRHAAARAGEAMARHDLGWREWLVINQVRTLVRRTGALERQLAVANTATAMTRARLTTDRQNLEQGDARIDDTSLSQIAFLDAQDRALALERTLQATRLQLNALVGLSPQVELQLAPGAPTSAQPACASPSTLASRALAFRLDLIALRDGYEMQERRVQLATRTALPLPQLSLGRDRDSAAVWTTSAAATLGLPLWNRGRGDIAVAHASRAQLAAEYLARVHQMQSDIATLCVDLESMARQRGALAKELPALRDAATRLAAAGRDGEVSRVSLEVVRTALLDKELALLSIDQARSEAEVTLDTAIGDFIRKVRR